MAFVTGVEDEHGYPVGLQVKMIAKIPCRPCPAPAPAARVASGSPHRPKQVLLMLAWIFACVSYANVDLATP